MFGQHSAVRIDHRAIDHRDGLYQCVIGVECGVCHLVAHGHDKVGLAIALAFIEYALTFVYLVVVRA